MTTLATFIGLLPIMFGTGTGSDVRQRIGASMVGGLFSAALLTLVVIPALYMIVKAFHHRKRFQAASNGYPGEEPLPLLRCYYSSARLTEEYVFQAEPIETSRRKPWYNPVIMIKTQRTYRFLSVLVVLALLVSAGVPLVQYVCGMSAQSARAMPTVAMSEAMPGAPCPSAAGCQDASTGTSPVTSALPLAVDQSPSCCAAEVAGKMPAVTVASKTAWASALLPVVAVLSTEALDHNSTLSFSADRGPDVTSRPVSIPIRLFVTVFLL